MDNPKIISICGMEYSEAATNFYSHSEYLGSKAAKGSSQVDEDDNYSGEMPVPSVLQVCSESRLIAQKVYTLMAMNTYGGNKREGYFNTLYDYFYIGGLHAEVWTNFKILVDLVIKLNTTRPLRRQVQRDLTRLQNIRFLIVEFNVFSSAPARVWAEFPNLQKIIIGVFPYDTINNNEKKTSGLYRRFRCIKPQRGTKYGERVSWLLEHAETALNKVKIDEKQEWAMPKLEVVIRRTGYDIDDEVVEQLYDSEEECASMREDPIEDVDENDDSTWYAQAEARMKPNITRKQISLLKQKHHPSRQVTHPKRHPGKKYGDWITDSETEDGHQHRPHIDEDDP